MGGDLELGFGRLVSNDDCNECDDVHRIFFSFSRRQSHIIPSVFSLWDATSPALGCHITSQFHAMLLAPHYTYTL